MKSKNTYVAALGAISVAGALGGWIYVQAHAGSGAAPAAPRSAAPRAAELRTPTPARGLDARELGAIREQIRGLEQQMEVLQQARPASDAESAERKAQVAELTPERKAELAGRRQQISSALRNSRREAVERALAAEPVDRSWSVEKENGIRTLFESRASSGDRLDDVDCRTNFCRVLVSHTDANGSHGIGDVFLSDAFAGGGMTLTDADGLHTTLYAYRSGREQYRKELMLAAREATLARFRDE